MTLVFRRRVVAYSVLEALERGLRGWLAEALAVNYGGRWLDGIPNGVVTKATARAYQHDSTYRPSEPLDILEFADFPDLDEAIQFLQKRTSVITIREITVQDLAVWLGNAYELRNRVAHLRQPFTYLDMDSLLEIATNVNRLLRNDDLARCIGEANDIELANLANVPAGFFVLDEPEAAYSQNLPIPDYLDDGGFQGRTEDLRKLEAWIRKYQFVTVTGTGGTGKTALTLELAYRLWQSRVPTFEAIVWISAKLERLTPTGIELIRDAQRTLDDALDAILRTVGWVDELRKPMSDKLGAVRIMLNATDRGVLLIIDNLESIEDEDLLDFIRDVPLPNRVLITSRIGLGELERRYQLGELDRRDARNLVRAVARERGLMALSRQPDELLDTYLERIKGEHVPFAVEFVPVAAIVTGRATHVNGIWNDDAQLGVAIGATRSYG